MGHLTPKGFMYMSGLLTAITFTHAIKGEWVDFAIGAIFALLTLYLGLERQRK